MNRASKCTMIILFFLFCFSFSPPSTSSTPKILYSRAVQTVIHPSLLVIALYHPLLLNITLPIVAPKMAQLIEDIAASQIVDSIAMMTTMSAHSKVSPLHSADPLSKPL